MNYRVKERTTDRSRERTTETERTTEEMNERMNEETKELMTGRTKELCYTSRLEKSTAHATKFSQIQEHHADTHIKWDESSIAIFFNGGAQDVTA